MRRSRTGLRRVAGKQFAGVADNERPYLRCGVFGGVVAEYIAKLHDHRLGAEIPSATVGTVTEFEAAALALEEFRKRGVQFDGESGLELLEGNVTASKPVPVKEIMYWLREKHEGQALAKRDGLERLLDYVRG